MASINSSGGSSGVANNIFSALGVKNNGIGGLNSGLDTDSLVEAMTMGTRSKIAKQQQQKQLLTWKQSAYRSVANTISNFKNKFFSFSSANASSQNLLSSTFYNSFKATSSSGLVSVKPTSSSTSMNTSNFTIKEIHQLATAQSLNAANSLSTELTGSLDMANYSNPGHFINQTLTVQANGTTKTIALDSLDGLTTTAAVEKELQKLLDNEFGFKENMIINVGGTNKAFKDMTTAEKNTVLNGSDKRAVRNVNVDINTSGEIKLSSDSSRVTVTKDCDVLSIAKNATNRVDTSTRLKDIAGLGENLAGGTYKFQINGADITMDANDTIATLMTKINNSTANVRMSYNASTDSFAITSKVTGSGNNLKIKDTYGNLMSSIFGSESSDNIIASNLAKTDGLTSLNGYAAMSNSERLDFINKFNHCSFNVTIGNTTKAVTINTLNINGLDERIKNGIAPDPTEMAGLLDYALDSAFGNSDILRQGAAFTFDGTNINFAANSGVTLSIDNNKTATSRDLVGMLGFAADNRTNAIDLNDPAVTSSITLGELGISGDMDIAVNGASPSAISLTNVENMTVDQLIAAFAGSGVDLSVSNVGTTAKPEYRLVLETNGNHVEETAPTTNTAFKTLFNANSYQKTAEAYGSNMVLGQNAELTVDDGDGNISYIVQSNNTFELYGADVTLNGVTTSTDNNIKVGVQNSPDELLERVKTFIDEYNTLIESLNALIYEEKNSDYSPLSDEQKADLSASEIEKIETEAKKGLLRSDNILRGIVSELRATVFSKVASLGLAGYDLGITTADTVSDGITANGKLKISEKDLLKAIENNPDAVRTVFTDPQNGIAVKMNAILDKAINTSAINEKRGSLVRMAGTQINTGNNTNSLGRQIDTVNSKIESLKKSLEVEYNRYWKKFSSLEVALQRLNMQASQFNQGY